MEVMSPKLVRFTVRACILATGTLLLGLAAGLIYEKYYPYWRAIISLKYAGIETTELWQVSDSSEYCGRTANGGWVDVLDKIYIGQIAEDGCIENTP